MANRRRMLGALLVPAATLLALSAPAAAAAGAATQLDIAACTGAVGQLWTLPAS